MKYEVNGEQYNSSREPTVSETLVMLEKEHLPLTVLINGKSVPSENYGTTKIRHGDSVSVIIFMGGG